MNKIIFPAFFAFSVFILFSCKSTPQRDKFIDLVKQDKNQEAKGRFTYSDDINETDEDLNTALHIAAMKNNQALLEFLISKGAKTDLKNFYGKTPLHLAIDNNSYECASILSQIGENLYAVDDETGQTALEKGLSKSEDYYNLFITETTGKLKDYQGRTLVHYFAQTQDSLGLELSKERGLELSEKDNAGLTPLDLAFQNAKDPHSAEIAATLIMYGADQVKTEFSYFQDAISNRNLDMRLEDGQTPLHIASILGHTGIAHYLLENNAQTNVQDSTGTTPLHEAVRYGNLEIVQMILNAGANVNAKDNLGKTPILLAIPEKNSLEIYKTLLKFKADATEKDMYGDTALHTATMTNVPVAVLQELVNGGAEINARNKEGVTALLVALENHNLQHVQFYASHGADIHSKDNKGSSPLKIALASKDNFLEMIINRYNIDSRDSQGNTPLHIAILEDASLAKIQLILSLTNDVNQRNSEGNNALFLAIIKNREKVGNLLLAKGADIFSTNNLNYSPLRLALKAGGSVMEWLITPQTVKQTDGSGNTVLHYAAEWEVLDAIENLIVKGVNPQSQNANGETPLFNAVKTNNSDLVDLLISKGCKVNQRDNLGSTPLHHAVRWEAPKAVIKLIEKGANVNAQNISGKSPLSEAVLAGKLETVKLLLASNADSNSSDITGRTVLMDAIRGQNPQIVKLLLQNNASVHIQETNGRNSYHEAALTGNIEIINIIKNAGGNALSRDKNGNTPFSLSLSLGENVMKAVLGNDKYIQDSDGNTPVHVIVKNNGRIKDIEFLINEKYPIDTRNSEGYTPLGIAVKNNKTEIAEILLKNKANPFISIDKQGNNAVILALKKGEPKMLSNIVKYSGTLTDIQGNTILHYAAKISDASTVKTLISYGLDINAKNISGETPYDTAERWNRKQIAQILTKTE